MTGLPIISIIDGSPADNIGLKNGDKILVYNDVRIENLIDYINA